MKIFLNKDRALSGGARAAAFLAMAVTLAVFCFLAAQAGPLLKKAGPGAFFTGAQWAPASGHYSLLPMVAGSFWATLLAMLLAAPLGLAVAVFVVFYAPSPVAKLLRVLLWLLAGIPSVVYGFWGLMVLVPWLLRLRPPGVSLLAGGLILALMILPTIALLAESALGAVPPAYLLGARALGAGRWSTVCSVALPAARSGLGTGILLGLGRALGETMAVVMVMGNTVQFPKNLLDPARTLTANIALEMAYALGDHQRALFVTGFVLLLAVTGLVLLAEKLRDREGRP